MADNEDIAVQGGAEEPQAPASKTGEAKTYNEDYVKDLREEAKRNRLESKELRAKVEQLTAQFEKIGNPQELAERLQKIEAERETERDRAKAAEAKALRLEIGAEFALPPELADVLKGETAEELRAHAEKLKPYVAASEPDGLRRRPSSLPVPGGAPAGETDAQKRERLFGKGGNNKLFG